MSEHMIIFFSLYFCSVELYKLGYLLYVPKSLVFLSTEDKWHILPKSIMLDLFYKNW